MEVMQFLLDSGLSDEDIMRLAAAKVKEFAGFINHETALFFIAKERGLNQESLNSELREDDNVDYDDFLIEISDIEINTSNIVILGRVGKIHPIREFSRKDGTLGRVGSFSIVDNSGSTKVVLWDDQVNIMNDEYFKFNEVIKIIGGYTKEGMDGHLEIQLGKKGKIMLAPDDISPEKIPKLADREAFQNLKSISIAELHDREQSFIPSVIGIVKIEEFCEKTLKKGGKSFLLRFYLSDNKNSIIVVVWGMEAIECFKTIDNDLAIKISNVVLKKSTYSGNNELHFTKKTLVEPL